jgi:hypothetical protein
MIAHSLSRRHHACDDDGAMKHVPHLATSLLLLASGCATAPESIRELPAPEQWAAAEAAQDGGDLAGAQLMYELIFADQKVPAAAWRCAELVVELRRQEPGKQFAEQDDAFRLVPRVLALALEGDEDTARAGIELLRDRLEGERDRKGFATLLLGDLDMRAGKHAEACAKYWSVTAELLMDDYRDGGQPVSEVAAWSALREMECAMLQDDWLVARRRLGLKDAISLAPAARPYANSELCEHVRAQFPRWLERVTDPDEKRAGVRKQLAQRPFVDGLVQQVGDQAASVAVDSELTEVQLLLTSGDVLTAVVPAGSELVPATFVGHGRIDRHDGAIHWGMIDGGRLREGIAMTAHGLFDVVDDFEVQNTAGPMRGEKLRANGSIQRHTLRVFRTTYDDGQVAVDYFDRRTGRHLQLRLKTLDLLSVTNEPMKALSDADRADELAREEHFRRYGAQESAEDAELRAWRERNGSRAFQFNVDPEEQVCIKCRGVGHLWHGSYATQTAANWQRGRPHTVLDPNVTVYHSAEMVTCHWCNGTGQR